MDNQTNTSGGANIGGDVNAGRDVVGRDQIINYIVIVGRFLDLAQVEGILPKVKEPTNFADIINAVDGTINARMDSDLAEATAFAGEILADFLLRWIPADPQSVIPLRKLFNEFTAHVGEKLYSIGLWENYGSRTRQYEFSTATEIEL